MTDDERAHTRNWMCALSNVKEESITCNGGTIRIDYPTTTGLVVSGNGACRFQPDQGWKRPGKAYAPDETGVREQRNKQAYRIPDVARRSNMHPGEP